MRQRGLALLHQAAGGLAAGKLHGALAGSRQRLAPLAAALHEGNGSGVGVSSQAGSLGQEEAIAAAAPPTFSAKQRGRLLAVVRDKLATAQAELGPGSLWALREQPALLAQLGVGAEELQDVVLKKHGGSGPAALQALATLVAAKEAAAMEEAVRQFRRQQQAQPPPAQQPQQQAQAQALPQAQGYMAQGYVPSMHVQQMAGGAAGQQPLERTPPSSSQASGAYPTRAQQQQQQQQPAQPPAVRASIRDLLNERHIRLTAYAPGEYRIICPECMGGDKGEKSLGVTIKEGSESAVWNCFRAKCGWTGGVNTRQGTSKAYRQYTNDSGFAVTAMRKRKEESPARPRPRFDAALSPEVLAFFAARGIGAATLARNRVAQETLPDGSVAIAFPYYRDGQLVNIKYRALGEKKFWQVKGAEKVLFGLDDVSHRSEIVVVEGEMDKLALEEAGVRNVVSVPDGAPARVREGGAPAPEQDTKFSYLWNCRAWLDQATKVVIATDNDAPGDALAEELARRLGRERCWRVRWPLCEEDHAYAAGAADADYVRQSGGGDAGEGEAAGAEAAAGAAAAAEPAGGGDGGGAGGGGAAEALQLRVQPAYYRKDANEVLMRDGAPMLAAFLAAAEPFPIRGLLRFHEYYDDIMKYYRLEHKDGQGRSTGWPSLDAYYQVVPGELTIVTGVPNSGKSEWIDALLANLAEQHGWSFALCSMEKKATDHARQLVEKYIGKPFFDLPYARSVRRMSERELDEGLDWIDDRFHLVRYEDDALPAVDWVLDVARAAVYRYGIRGLVIDPYNELDHQRPAAMSETEYVSQMLTKVKRFAQTSGVHVWFVAHPRQLREWRGQAPNLYDISGSAHFINKADNGIVVHRERDPQAPDAHQVSILVRKVRNKAAGTIGDCVLEYERVNGRYVDPAAPAGGPRTAARVDFDALAAGEGAVGAAARAPGARGAQAAHAAGAAQGVVAGVPLLARGFGTEAATPAPPPAISPEEAAERMMPPLPQPPSVRLDGSGFVSGGPAADQQEIDAWLEGDSLGGAA